ncbi:hypothetical protein N798_02600 [Knoellia flava TL1]|uniref:Uncharacterized protein n=2 Tax=Knoellia flava TaxID=913969 RepID=A0A8H9KPC4_9MICO|nr:hypothetical protein [Knoellia flava]KGN35538.1 hypothetical protein N798_02600 [Knoellia flava TL1]GGB68729.1 hypothetical protein GCM10011314_04990 [Knoellia flava]
MGDDQTPLTGHGLVLVRGSAAASARWVRRGLAAVRVCPLQGWTGVCLAEDRARAVAPYDVGLEILAARHVPTRHRPAIGLFVIDGCAVVTVQARGWRLEQRWLVWEPGRGVRRTPDLPALPAALVVDVAGARSRTTPAEVTEHFADPGGEPLDVLVGLMRLLGLPGEELLRDGADESHLRVDPSPRSIAAFDALVAEESAHRAEQDL